MDDFNHIADDCSAFTNDELDVYLKRILTNVKKLKTITSIQLQEADLSMNVSFQPILISQYYRIRMAAGMWIWDRYPDEHQTPSALRIASINGRFGSFDNRRLYAVQEARLKRILVIQKKNITDVANEPFEEEPTVHEQSGQGPQSTQAQSSQGTPSYVQSGEGIQSLRNGELLVIVAKEAAEIAMRAAKDAHEALEYVKDAVKTHETQKDVLPMNTWQVVLWILIGSAIAWLISNYRRFISKI